MILTCAGYVAPYAWDRLRAEWRSWSTPVQVDASRLRALLAELDTQLIVLPQGTSTLRNSIPVAKIQDGAFGAWCVPAELSYVFTSGDKDCLTCVNTRRIRDRTDVYECTGDCLPVEKPDHWPADTF